MSSDIGDSALEAHTRQGRIRGSYHPPPAIRSCSELGPRPVTRSWCIPCHSRYQTLGRYHLSGHGTLDTISVGMSRLEQEVTPSSYPSSRTQNPALIHRRPRNHFASGNRRSHLDLRVRDRPPTGRARWSAGQKISWLATHFAIRRRCPPHQPHCRYQKRAPWALQKSRRASAKEGGSTAKCCLALRWLYKANAPGFCLAVLAVLAPGICYLAKTNMSIGACLRAELQDAPPAGMQIRQATRTLA